jgi:hypothetical protein
VESVSSLDETLISHETGEAQRKGSEAACSFFGGNLQGGAKTACGLSLALRRGQRPGHDLALLWFVAMFFIPPELCASAVNIITAYDDLYSASVSSGSI